jgi:hypothetical protein
MTNESVMESMLSKLKEDVKYASDSLTDQILDSSRIDSLLKNLKEVAEKSTMDQSTKASLSMIMLELQHLRDQCVYYTGNITRAAKDFTAYLHVLENLYEQNKNVGETAIIRKIPDADGNGGKARRDAENMKRADSGSRSASEPQYADQWWDRFKEQKGGRHRFKLP